MGSILGQIGGGAGRFMAQVTVSVTATLVAAAITGAYLGHEPTPAPRPLPASVLIDDQFGKTLLDAAFTDEGVRTRRAYPVEFAAVFGPGPARPHTSLVSAEWSVAPVAEPQQGRPRARPVVTAAVLPPQRPAEPAQVAALSPEPEAALADEERARLFGVALPRFVPRGETVVRTVVNLGDKVAGWAELF